MSKNKNKEMNVMKGIDFSCNMTEGACPIDCIYCSICNRCFRGKPSGPLRLRKDAFKDDLGRDQVIWLMSITEPGWVPFGDLVRIMEYAGRYDNIYHIVTKHPRGLLNAVKAGLKLPPRTILALTMESDMYFPALYRGKAMPPDSRMADFIELLRLTGCRGYVIVDPAVKFNLDIFPELILSCRPYMVYYGEDTSGSGLPTPSMEEAEALFERLRPHTEVMMLGTFKKKYNKWKERHEKGVHKI